MSVIRGITLFLLLTALSGCSILAGSPVMSLGVSSDGHYAVSAHQNNALYLWDIKAQKKTRIARDANLYSAFFIPDSNAFMWQNLDREVVVQTADGKELRRFTLDYDVYGHALNLEQDVYVSADAEYTLRAITQGKNTQLKAPGGSFRGYGKVLNLSISNDGTLLVTAGTGWSGFWVNYGDFTLDITEKDKKNGYDDFYATVLWSLESLEPLAKLPGNSSKTHASISPDGQWVVSGDENGLGRFWNTDIPEQRFNVASYYHGLHVGQDEEGNTKPYDISGLIPYPKLQVNDNTLATVNAKTVATGFISNSEYYVYIAHAGGGYGYRFDPYAVLFETGSPWPIKYFELGTNPMPSVREYHRNLTISTAPEAGILVTGQHSKGGINVYQFDAENLTLKRIWVGR